MHEAVDAGFNSLFSEIDARDVSKVQMERDSLWGLFPAPPGVILESYFAFLDREHPALADQLKNAQGLKRVLRGQSLSKEGILKKKRDRVTLQNGKRYYAHAFYEISTSELSSRTPTFLELGQTLFTDALAAIKLHLIAQLMERGHIEKGPVIDYEGAAHLSSKTFFLRYPEYAMEVVLRTVNELMVGKVKGGLGQLWKGGKFSQISKMLERPDWNEVFREIVRVPLMQPEDAPDKSAQPGPNQRKLIDRTPDVLELFGIDPEEALPSDEEIQKLRDKLRRSRQNK